MKIQYLIASLIFLSACSDKNQEKSLENYVSPIVSGGQSEAELKESLKGIEQEEKERLAEEARNTTSLAFEKDFHDFGNVKKEVLNTYKFKVTNTGKVPLIIEDVSASCGCTTPHKPEKPIPPGASDYIEVGFKSKSDQRNEITKTVTVTANTNPKISELKIRAFVVWE